MGRIVRKKISDHQWRRLMRDEALIKQGGRCKYCGCRLPRDEATADHVVPLSSKGADNKDNIVAACEPCNNAKRSLPARTFLRMLKGLEPTAHYNVAVRGVFYRLEKRTNKAINNILSVA